jgi:hypothetical protein
MICRAIQKAAIPYAGITPAARSRLRLLILGGASRNSEKRE